MRARLDERLTAAAFGKIIETATWLTASGFAIGKSSVGRYALALRRRLESETKERVAIAVFAEAVHARLRGDPIFVGLVAERIGTDPAFRRARRLHRKRKRVPRR